MEKIINKENSSRLLELDVLRGIAALGVVLFHYTTRYDELFGHSSQLLFDFKHGDLGVALFFIISGFVIFMTLEKTKRSLDFLISRFARLYPAYWVAIILTFTIVSLCGLPEREASLYDAILNLTMWQQFIGVKNVDGVYWTLQVELSFYVIMFCLYKFNWLKHIDFVCIGWIALVIGHQIVSTKYNLEFPPHLQTFLLIIYAPLFIIGIMFFQIKKHEFSCQKYIIIGLSLVGYHQVTNSRFKLLIILMFVIIFYLIIDNKLRFINLKPLIFLGNISYPLYLVHQNIGYVIIRRMYEYNINPNVSIFVAIVTAFFLATLINLYIEKPSISWIKNKYQQYQVKT
jgi:peptidoglycan/LPS O-acetylase OafA/YrhL